MAQLQGQPNSAQAWLAASQTRFQNWAADTFGGVLAEASDGRSPAKKLPRHEPATSIKENLPTGPGGRPCFDPPQLSFMDKAITASVSGFAQVVQAEFQEHGQKIVEAHARIDECTTHIQGHDHHLGTLEQKNAALQAQIIALQKAREDLKAKTDQIDTAQQHATQLLPPGVPQVPAIYQQPDANSNRVDARMGSLGWDVDPLPITELARTVLQEAQIPQEWVNALAPASRIKGSAVDILFVNNSYLEQAKLRVRALNKNLPNTKGPVWLDYKRTREQNAPARCTHRAYDCVTSFEISHFAINERYKYDKKVEQKQIWRQPGNQIWGQFALGRWQWSEEAKDRMATDINEMQNYISK